MTKQQQKRRRKRYEPGSAYAGDVRPTGVLGFMGSTRMIQVIFILMALTLGAGGIVGVLRLNANNSSNQNSPDFVDQSKDKKPTATPPDAENQVQQFADPPEMTIDPDKTYTATIKTDAGDIVVRLFADQTPETVNNFVFLANKGFYNDQLVDFADPQFSVETGNPYCTKTEGVTTCRSDGGPGYNLPQEQPGPFSTGTLGMINGSQFFIAFTDAAEFAAYTPFGEVTAGLDVAKSLSQGTQITSVEISET